MLDQGLMSTRRVPLGWSIKICGVTSPDDALRVCNAGAGAIGLNFYPRSLRSVSLEQARGIVEAIQSLSVCPVGVFVNEAPARVLDIAGQIGLDWIQLHGDERPDWLQKTTGLKVLRAIRLGPGEAGSAIRAARQWLEAGASAILLDAPLPKRPDPDAEESPDDDRNASQSENGRERMAGAASHEGKWYGGTGTTIDWAAAREVIGALDCPVILAGGLNPGNVAQAIRVSGALAVDVASGVENLPGRKVPELVAAFVEAARAAFGDSSASGSQRLQ